MDPNVAGSNPVDRPSFLTHMTLFQALIIGLLQGLTEFLPVSSSAHLKLAKLFFDIPPSESQVVFDLVCHLGTLMVLLFFLKDEIKRLFQEERQKLGLLFIALIPLIPCYLLLKPLREFASQPHYLGLCLMITASMLLFSHKLRWRQEPATVPMSRKIKSSLWIGTMQSAALIPGISRSASTICCAKALGWKAKEAVRFSFLLSIPTIIGGNCLELLKLYLSHEPLTTLCLSQCAIGFGASFGAGLLIVKTAISYLEKGNLKPFGWYCLILGITISVYLNLW